MTSRLLQLPKCVLESTNANEINKNTIFVAYSDMFGKFPLQFQPVKLEDDQRNWPVFQYDRESCHGSCIPRDMIFGFQVISTMPFWKEKGSALQAFERFTARQWSQPMMIPPLESLQRLKSTSWLQDGMWILLVRTPRPYGSRNTIPFIRKPEVISLQVALIDNPRNAKLESKLEFLQDRSKQDTVHPTEANLFLTKSGTLVQGVTPNIVCARCQAKGHHMAHVHDEVWARPNPCVSSVWPPWMNVKPLPDEVLEVPTTDDTKGFEVEIRQVKTHVPLRLARQFKLRGIEVEGDVAKCGVMEFEDDAK